MTTLPTVMLLHGWGGTWRNTWDAAGWAAALQDSGRAVRPVDLPGHGGPASPDPAAYGDLVGMLDAALPDGALDVVGFSLGGKLALALAARRPDRFRRIVIGGVGDNLFAPEPSGEAVAAALIAGVGVDAHPAMAALVRYAAAPGNDPAALAAVLRRPSNPRLATAELAAVRGVLLVNGEDDAIAIPDARLCAALPDARVVRLPGVDHLSLPASRAFRDLALAHLTS